MEELLNKFGVNQPSKILPEPVGSTVLHRIGRVELTKHVFKDHSIAFDCSILSKTSVGSLTRIYERNFSGRSAYEALAKARRALPRPLKQIEGEIIAMRGWSVFMDCLRSLNGGSSTCEDENLILRGPVQVSHESPTRENASGLYSVKPEFMPDLIKSYNPPVYGVIGVYGRVVQHARGYRSSHYIIRRLAFRKPCSQEFASLFAKRYDCEVKVEKPL